jgi:hypothetical protein
MTAHLLTVPIGTEGAALFFYHLVEVLCYKPEGSGFDSR